MFVVKGSSLLRWALQISSQYHFDIRLLKYEKIRPNYPIVAGTAFCKHSEVTRKNRFVTGTLGKARDMSSAAPIRNQDNPGSKT